MHVGRCGQLVWGVGPWLLQVRGLAQCVTSVVLLVFGGLVCGCVVLLVLVLVPRATSVVLMARPESRGLLGEVARCV